MGITSASRDSSLVGFESRKYWQSVSITNPQPMIGWWLARTEVQFTPGISELGGRAGGRGVGCLFLPEWVCELQSSGGDNIDAGVIASRRGEPSPVRASFFSLLYSVKSRRMSRGG